MGLSPSSAAVVDLEMGAIPVKPPAPAPAPDDDEVACERECSWILGVVCAAIDIGFTTMVALIDGPGAAVTVAIGVTIILGFFVTGVTCMIEDEKQRQEMSRQRRC